MRVVVVTPSLPLPFGKADARWLHVVVTGLSRRGHDVLCIACTEESDENVAAATAMSADSGYEFVHVPLELEVEPVARRRARSALTPFNEYTRVAALRETVSAAALTADVVHVEHLFASRIAEGLPNAVTYLHHLEVIDWEERVGLDRRTRVVRAQMERATKQILRRSTHVIGATSRLVARAKATAPHLETAVVPVSIDPSLYDTLPLRTDPVAGVIGSMHWYPSRSAADRALTRLWPAIHQEVPEARLLVAGWGSEERLGHRFPLAGAELMGAVDRPEDFFGAISTLLYPPARGSGFKIKVLEAMAYGRPAISNHEGLEGLTDRGELVPVHAESDDDFIVETVALLRDGPRRAALAAAGRAQIDDVYSPEPAIDRLLDAYERLGFPAGRPSPQLAPLLHKGTPSS